MSAVHMSGQGVVAGMRSLLMVAILVIPFGAAYGTAAIEHGMAPMHAMAASAFVFAGAAQFATLELWREPFPYLSLVLVAFAVNLRHVILGATLAPHLNALPLRQRVASLLLLSDANFAHSQQALRKGDHDIGHLLGGGIVLWLAWNAGTALGCVIADQSATLSHYGFDIVMLAFFAAVLANDMRSFRHVWPVSVAVVITVITAGVAPDGWNIILAALAAGFVGAMHGSR